MQPTSSPPHQPRDDVALNLFSGGTVFHLAEVVLLIAAIVPFVALAFFAHPQTDDFCSAAMVRDLGFTASMTQWYMGWTGRFFAIVMMNVGPLSFGSFTVYKLVPVGLLAGLFLSLLWFGREIVSRAIPLSVVARATLLVFAIYLYLLAAPAEALFWYTGAIIFTLATILVLVGAAAAIRGGRSSSTKAAWGWATVSGLATFAAGGSNEIALLLLTLGLSVVVWRAYRSHMRRWTPWLLPLALTLAAGVIDVLAPGNLRRAEVTSGLTSVIGPLAGSAVFAAATILRWLSAGPVLVALLIALISGVAASRHSGADIAFRGTSWHVPIVVAAFGVWLSFFFTHWASGFALRPGPPSRVVDVTLLFFLLAALVGAFMMGVQVLGRFRSLSTKLVPQTRWLTLLLALMLFGRGNVRVAWLDLVSGRAAAYDRDLHERYALLESARRENVAAVLPPLTRVPEALHVRDITTDPADWRNSCYARYWGVPEVRLSSRRADPREY